ncbi:unnamed protein product [Withania somnifera]
MRNKKSKSDSRKSSMPEEIIYAIFSTLPVNSLMRFKCLSKFYNSLVSNPSFVDIHHGLSISHLDNMKFLARSTDGNFSYTIDQKAEQEKSIVILIDELDGIRYRRFDYVNGLFCLWSTKDHPPAIYNPTTRRIRYLPCLNSVDDGFTCYSYLFGFEPDIKKYKILMSSTLLRMNSPIKQWVLTLGSSESWREIKSAPCSLSLLTVGGVCIEGVTYFLGTHGDKRCIVEFNFKTENFRIISLWNNIIEVPAERFYSLIQVNGKLAVVGHSRRNVNEIRLRILQSCETEEWVKHTVVLSEALCSSLTTHFLGCFYGSTPDGEIVFISNSKLKRNCIVLYDLKKKSWREIKIKELAEGVEIIGIYNHVGSLLSCIYC